VAGLLTLAKAAPLLRCRDGRTARKRLAALAVPVVTLDGREGVTPADVAHALRAHSRPLDPGAPMAAARGSVGPRSDVVGRPTERPEGPRRADGRPRPSRVVQTQAASEAYVASATSSTPRPSDDDRGTI
jgi:hypothetical protein